MRKDAKPIYWPRQAQLSADEAAHLELEAGRFWDKFYRTHQGNFFKDRHYLSREFPELKQGQPSVFEVGCGVGNTTFPILRVNPRAVVHACDFSQAAIDCLQRSEHYSPERVHAFVADVTTDDLTKHIAAESTDLCTMIFVLSALTPLGMRTAVGNVARVLKKGALVFVRDYAIGDLAEAKLRGRVDQRCIEEHFYLRGDGTRAYYFSEAALTELFQGCGFACLYTRQHNRTVENRSQATSMERRWIQGLFQYEGSSRLQASETNAPGRSLTLTGEGRGERGVVTEWDTGQDGQDSDPAGDDGLSSLFQPTQDVLEVEEQLEIAGAGIYTIRSMSRELKHTVGHTGLMLWDAARPLANLLANSPALLNRKTVLELGCGANPLVMIAALRHARRVVSTDGSLEALQRMAANLEINSSKVMIERARLAVLTWGEQTQIAALRREYSQGFDVILGADVLYVEEFVPQLFNTAKQLLAPSQKALLLLCHITRRVSEAKICEMAQAAGFVQDKPVDKGQADDFVSTPFRLLGFRHVEYGAVDACLTECQRQPATDNESSSTIVEV